MVESLKQERVWTWLPRPYGRLGGNGLWLTMTVA